MSNKDLIEDIKENFLGRPKPENISDEVLNEGNRKLTEHIKKMSKRGKRTQELN